MEPTVQPSDSSMAVGGSVVTGGGSSEGTRGSGVGGDVRPSGSPSRDSAKGKSIVVEAEETTEVWTGPIEFQPIAGSLGH